MTNRKIEYRVIPPEADAEFAAGMEEVLDTSARPYDPACPVICMDEQPIRLLKETRTPIPATKEHGRRVDYEYERAGTVGCVRISNGCTSTRRRSKPGSTRRATSWNDSGRTGGDTSSPSKGDDTGFPLTEGGDLPADVHLHDQLHAFNDRIDRPAHDWLLSDHV